MMGRLEKIVDGVVRGGDQRGWGGDCWLGGHQCLFLSSEGSVSCLRTPGGSLGLSWIERHLCGLGLGGKQTRGRHRRGGAEPGP